MRKSRNGQPSISMEAISKVLGLAMSCKIMLQINTSALKQVKPSFPKQMTEITATGFRRVGDKVQYFSTSGYLAKNTFIQVGANQWYYFDKNGNMVTGEQVIDGKNTSS